MARTRRLPVRDRPHQVGQQCTRRGLSTRVHRPHSLGLKRENRWPRVAAGLIASVPANHFARTPDAERHPPAHLGHSNANLSRALRHPVRHDAINPRHASNIAAAATNKARFIWKRRRATDSSMVSSIVRNAGTGNSGSISWIAVRVAEKVSGMFAAFLRTSEI